MNLVSVVYTNSLQLLAVVCITLTLWEMNRAIQRPAVAKMCY